MAEIRRLRMVVQQLVQEETDSSKTESKQDANRAENTQNASDAGQAS